MGCDIHMTVEKRVGERWVCVRTLHSFIDTGGDFAMPAARDRNYRRFALLAGVRGDGPPARGIPADASETTRLLIQEDGDDGHSHSWMSIDEALPIFAATQRWRRGIEREGSDWDFFGIERDTSPGEYRIVFWFDN